MRILTIQAAYFPMIGGAELFHQKTAEYLVSQGHEVDVLTCIWQKPDIPWPKWKQAEEQLNGVKIIRVKPLSSIHGLKSVGAIFPLYFKAMQQINFKKYDLLHCHIYPASLVGSMLKRQTGLPLIITVQGGDIGDYQENNGFFARILKPVIATALKRADIVHVVSKDLKNQVRQMGIENSLLIPNGVDNAVFKPANKKELRGKYKLPLECEIIVSHSRLTPKNGLDILIRAIQPLKDQNIMLLIIGSGEQEKELIKLTKELKLKNEVKFLGYLSAKETAQYLALADLFVRPSRAEGFGISFLEAMACGIPVIGTKVGGITDIVKSGETGILIEPENVSALTEALQDLLGDLVKREEIGKRGRLFAAEFYWEKIGSLLEHSYAKLI